MLEEKLEIYETLLTTFLNCDSIKLNKIFKLLRETRLVYGKEIFRKSIKEFLEVGDIVDCVNEAYYCILTNIVQELTNLEELDHGSYVVLSDANFNDSKVRFRFEDFRDLPVSIDEINQVTQKINEFLDLLNL